MEDGIYNSRRVTQANSDVLYFDELIGYVSDKIIWDIINMRKVASFIDDVIVRMEEHNKVVKEVVRRLENNLYVKPENISGKYKK